mmetsp:Transcript_9629/g.22593  ORF Transcript_9629/g.22593 Transcript_9629/m.22593 type:complete len:574 (-) Transcript_9629:2307-4028(-)
MGIGSNAPVFHAQGSNGTNVQQCFDKYSTLATFLCLLVFVSFIFSNHLLILDVFSKRHEWQNTQSDKGKFPHEDKGSDETNSDTGNAHDKCTDGFSRKGMDHGSIVGQLRSDFPDGAYVKPSNFLTDKGLEGFITDTLVDSLSGHSKCLEHDDTTNQGTENKTNQQPDNVDGKISHIVRNDIPVCLACGIVIWNKDGTSGWIIVTGKSVLVETFNHVSKDKTLTREDETVQSGSKTSKNEQGHFVLGKASGTLLVFLGLGLVGFLFGLVLRFFLLCSLLFLFFLLLLLVFLECMLVMKNRRFIFHCSVHGLKFFETPVMTILGHQFVIGATFANLSVRNVGNLISSANCRQTMGNNNGDKLLVFHNLVQSFLDDLFGFSIKSTCSFIEQEYLWLTKKSSGNSNTLLLSSTDLGRRSGTDQSIVTIGEFHDKVVGVGLLCGFLNLFLTSLTHTKLDILGNRNIKQGGFLGNKTNFITVPAGVEVLQVISIVRNNTIVWVVKVLNQLNNGRFSLSRRSDKGQCLTFINSNNQITENLIVRSGRIGKVNVVGRNDTSRLFRSRVHVLQAALAVGSG